jgi:hypothetical protein
VDDTPSERLDPFQRPSDVGHREVGQRKGIARATSASMDTHCWGSRVRLPALPLGTFASLQLDAEELRPEAPGALGIIGGELDQGKRGAWHCPHSSAAAS